MDTLMTYSGTEFQSFWEECGSEKTIHPADKPFLDYYNSVRPRNAKHPLQIDPHKPWPFDGPLDNAKVVICLANPNYPIGSYDDDECIKQRSGTASLPKCFENFYMSNIRQLNSSFEIMKDKLAIFNVCPYASSRLEGFEKRVVAGLPSVWAAQRHLRDVLIPKANANKIYLIIIRKHELWGVTEQEHPKNIVLERGRAMSGTMSPDTGRKIHMWLNSETNL
jgi:hypothetical protein